MTGVRSRTCPAMRCSGVPRATRSARRAAPPCTGNSRRRAATTPASVDDTAPIPRTVVTSATCSHCGGTRPRRRLLRDVRAEGQLAHATTGPSSRRRGWPVSATRASSTPPTKTRWPWPQQPTGRSPCWWCATASPARPTAIAPRWLRREPRAATSPSVAEPPPGQRRGSGRLLERRVAAEPRRRPTLRPSASPTRSATLPSRPRARSSPRSSAAR